MTKLKQFRPLKGKVCGQCHKIYDPPERYFDTDPTRKDGYRRTCKACIVMMGNGSMERRAETYPR